MTVENPASLWDYRRTVADQYRRARQAGVNETSWKEWRSERDGLLTGHTQSPITMDRRSAGVRLPFFPYDPLWHIEAAIEIDTPVDLTAGHSGS